METIREQKKALRHTFSLKRRQLHGSDKRDYDIALARLLLSLPQFQAADLLLCTLSTDEEIDTGLIIDVAHYFGMAVAVPRCLPERQMAFYYLDKTTELERSPWGILEPVVSSRPVVDYDGALCLVPALCCDREGYRLGYGGGYFDRFLSRQPVATVSLAYPGFVLERLPREATDRPVDRVLTL